MSDKDHIARCPRCASLDLVLTEIWHGNTIHFNQVGGVIESRLRVIDAARHGD